VGQHLPRGYGRAAPSRSGCGSGQTQSRRRCRNPVLNDATEFATQSLHLRCSHCRPTSAGAETPSIREASAGPTRAPGQRVGGPAAHPWGRSVQNRFFPRRFAGASAATRPRPPGSLADPSDQRLSRAAIALRRACAPCWRLTVLPDAAPRGALPHVVGWVMLAMGSFWGFGVYV